MQCTRTTTAHTIISKQSAASAFRALNGGVTPTSGSRPAFILVQRQYGAPRRQFSVTPQRHLKSSSNLLIKEFFPVKESEHIKKTPPAWHHPIYSEEQMNLVGPSHRATRNWSDWVALIMVRVLRGGLDLASGYKHDKAIALNKNDPAAATQKFAMNERKYLVRNIFLESVAGEFDTKSYT